jgi:hypothetical protein
MMESAKREKGAGEQGMDQHRGSIWNRAYRLLKTWASRLFRPGPPRYPGQIGGYVLSLEPAQYLASRYGPGWSPVRSVHLPGFGQPLLMNDFRPGIGCCSLVALTGWLGNWRAASGPSLLSQAIPADPGELFATVEREAVRHGYSLRKGRTNPFRIPGIVRGLWRRWPGRVRSGTTLVRTGRQIQASIDKGQPALINIAWGYYLTHSVLAVGYQLWQQESGRSLHLLVEVHDGWSPVPRLIDWPALVRPWSRDCSPHSVTWVQPRLPDAPRPTSA